MTGNVDISLMDPFLPGLVAGAVYVFEKENDSWGRFMGIAAFAWCYLTPAFGWIMAIPDSTAYLFGGSYSILAVLVLAGLSVGLVAMAFLLGCIALDLVRFDWKTYWFDTVVLVVFLTLCRGVVQLSGGCVATYVAVPFCFSISVIFWIFKKRWLGFASLILLLGVVFLFSPKGIAWYASIEGKHEERLAQRGQKEKVAEAERHRLENVEKLKTFALNHAPAIWETYQTLESEIDIQVDRNVKLRDTFIVFGRTPDDDNDYRKCEAWVEEMRRMSGELMRRLEDAYLAKRMAEATPGHADVEALWKKAQEDGIQEAEAATRRFREMTKQK